MGFGAAGIAGFGAAGIAGFGAITGFAAAGLRAGALRAAGFLAAVLRAVLRAAVLRAGAFLALVFRAALLRALAAFLATFLPVLRTVREALRAVLRTVRAVFRAPLRALALLVVRFFPLALVAMASAPILLCCRTPPLKRTCTRTNQRLHLVQGLPSRTASQSFFLIIRRSKRRSRQKVASMAVLGMNLPSKPLPLTPTKPAISA
jgi:hypothetical protein